MSLESMQSRQPETDYRTEQEFMRLSLQALASQLKSYRHPGYPGMGDRFRGIKSILFESGRLELSPEDTWNVGQVAPTDEERNEIAGMDYRTDSLGRPRHPWARTMAADVAVGVVMGKGFFREWGPNLTADPIVMQAGHVLLVERGDSGLWAVPGGFRDLNEETGVLEESLPAAIREAGEEAELDLVDYADPVRIYEGPVADIRMTANAWPETTAYLLDLGDDPALPPVRGGDDANKADWKPVEEAMEMQLHGSHNLLIELAWRRFCQSHA